MSLTVRSRPLLFFDNDHEELVHADHVSSKTAILFSPNLQFVHISLIFRQLILSLDSEQLKTIILRYIEKKNCELGFWGYTLIPVVVLIA